MFEGSATVAAKMKPGVATEPEAVVAAATGHAAGAVEKSNSRGGSRDAGNGGGLRSSSDNRDGGSNGSNDRGSINSRRTAIA